MEETLQSDEISFVGLLRQIYQGRRMIASIMFLGFLASLLYVFLVQGTYTATTALLPPEPDLSPLGLEMSQRGPTMPALIGRSGSAADLWVALMKSRTVSERLIKQFNLSAVYHTKTVNKTIRALLKRVKIVKSREEIVSVTVEDADPDRAAGMANAFVQELDRLNQSVKRTPAVRMKIFVEKRMNDEKAALVVAEGAVKVFQEKYGAVRLEAQASAAVSALGGMQGQIMAKEVELQTLLSYAGRQNPAVDLMRTELREMRSGLKNAEEGVGRSSKSVLIPTIRIPELGLQYARLLRDVRIRETVYGLLVDQYERSRIQEARDTPTLQILDLAKVPSERSSPKRKKIVAISTAASLLFAIGVVLSLPFLKGLKSALTSPQPTN